MSNLKLEAQITKAHVAGIVASISEPRAKDAYYDRETGEIVVQMRNGAKFSFPYQLGQGLQGASGDDLAEVEVTPSGEGLHWETLDVDFSIPALIKGIFGTPSWMAELGRSGGSVTSEAKAAAARENGKKGGRPRKK